VNIFWKPTIFAALCLAWLTASGCALIEPYGPKFSALGQGRAVSLASRLSPASQELDSWRDLEPAVRESLRYLTGRPQEKLALDHHWLRLTWGQLKTTQEHLLALLPELDRDPSLLGKHFTWRRITPETLLSGYYEPWIEASLEPHPEYPHPLYSVPRDLKKADLGKFHSRWSGKTLVYRMGEEGITPYHDRQAIDSGNALEGQAEIIAWAKDPVDVFFLHTQGSGRLALPDGSSKHILYAGTNGLPYVLLGKVLKKRGYLTTEEISMQSIRRVLSEHPKEAVELMAENPTYIFFRLAEDGPIGAINGKLTPLASVAVKPSFIPFGSLLALEAELPAFENEPSHKLAGLVFPQDTGSMRENHLDLFCGSSSKAEFWAGHMRHTAVVHILVSKDALDIGN
jgi:membrane-bound lytic murein transglycosylase A